MSLKQHDPLRKRKTVTTRAQGGHLCFAKEAIIKGQSDYLCISADPPVSFIHLLFFYFLTQTAQQHIECNVSGLEHIN